jgi:hypothetical protein
MTRRLAEEDTFTHPPRKINSPFEHIRIVPQLDELGLRTLLGELVDRVEGVSRLADRLHGLLQAVVAIGSQLDIADVLREIVTTAAEVADAQYAALGVLDPDAERRLSQFITVGFSDELIDEPRAMRLPDIS